jgi:outer membrane protein assembly factor BamB
MTHSEEAIMLKKQHLSASGGVLRTVVLLAASILCIQAARGQVEDTLAATLLGGEGIRAGLCIHLDSRDGKLTAALGEKYLVQGLTDNGADLEKARAHIRSRKLYGRVSVSMGSLRTLPYLDNLANAVVVRDLRAARIKGLSVDDVIRMLAPYGSACFGGVNDEGKLKAELEACGVKQIESPTAGWIRATKPYPEEMDEWPMYRHDSARSSVSSDELVRPSTSLRWITGNRTMVRPISELVSAGGVNFYLYPNNTKYTAIDERSKEEPGITVVARDAFNGITLWERKGLGKTMYSPCGRMLAANGWLYTYLNPKDGLMALDGLTGKTVKTFDFAAQVTTYHKGLLICGQGARRAYDSRTGELKWTGVRGIDPLVIDDDKIYVRGKETLTCVDAGTGKPVWTKPIDARAKGGLLCYRDGLIFTSGVSMTGKSNAAMWADTGEFAWSHSYGPPTHSSGRKSLFFMDGKAWLHQGTGKRDGDALVSFDPKTGRQIDLLPMPNKVKHRCYEHVATEKYILLSGIDFFDHKAKKFYGFYGARGSCGSGFLPANGLVYAGPTVCECFAHLRGVSAVGSDAPPTQVEIQAARKSRLQTGPGRPASTTAATTDWPTFRHDSLRSAATDTGVPEALKVQWTARVGAEVTSPVAAGGMVYVAAPREHRVMALAGKDGAEVWSFTPGGPVDSPPTIARGMAVFGCRDGWVYCLSADKGELIWKLRGAPIDRRIVSRSSVESSWPVHGSVIVLGDTVYFAAGRHSEVDGGIRLIAADLRSGKVEWEKTVVRKHYLEMSGRGPKLANEMNDILSTDGKTIYMHRRKFNVQNGEQQDKGTSLSLFGGQGGWLDDFAKPPYKWKFEMQIQRRVNDTNGRNIANGTILGLDGGVIFGMHNDKSIIFTGKGKKPIWTHTITPQECPKAIVRAAGKLIVSAMPDAKDTSRGEIWVLDPDADGMKKVACSLPAAPRHDSIAVIHNAVIVSTQDGQVIYCGAK